jgi:hypothetical protein
MLINAFSFLAFWQWHFFCWHVRCQHSLYLLTSGNIHQEGVTASKQRPHKFNLCHLSFIHVRIRELVYQSHALTYINYEQWGISGTGFTEHVRFCLKYGRFQRNMLLERQPIHRVRDSSVAVSWFRHYKFWKFLFQCWRTAYILKSLTRPDINLIWNICWNEEIGYWTPIFLAMTFWKRVWRACGPCCSKVAPVLN